MKTGISQLINQRIDLIKMRGENIFRMVNKRKPNTRVMFTNFKA